MAAYDIERESTKRDTLDLNRARQLARRKGDMDGVLKYTAMGEKMGLPVGRRVHDEELDGIAERRLASHAKRSGEAPMGDGLDAYDSRHSRLSGRGVGGFDFRQRKDRMMEEEAAPTQPAAEQPLLPAPKLADGASGPVDQASSTAAGSLTSRYRQMWQGAQSPGEADAILAKAQAEGVQLNETGLAAVSRHNAKGPSPQRAGAVTSPEEAARRNKPRLEEQFAPAFRAYATYKAENSTETSAADRQNRLTANLEKFNARTLARRSGVAQRDAEDKASYEQEEARRVADVTRTQAEIDDKYDLSGNAKKLTRRNLATYGQRLRTLSSY